jgi:uncharacterized protein (TIGR02217 family)
MSNAAFPVLPGLSWSVIKTPKWSTRKQIAISGREYRAAYFSLPLWKFKLSYEVLRAGAQQELQQLVGFFNARQGSFDTFLYADPTDSAVVAQQFGTGNGAATTFQLVRSLGGNSEPVAALQAAPSIYANGALQSSGVSVNLNTGLATFTVAPANGVALTWTGSFYYRCRFLHDELDLENFMQNLWLAKTVEFTSVKP